MLVEDYKYEEEIRTAYTRCATPKEIIKVEGEA